MSNRLSNEILADIKQALEKEPMVDGTMEPAEAWLLIEESQERRAADLTPDDIRIVRSWEAVFVRLVDSIDEYTPAAIAYERLSELAVVRKILAAHGVKP